MYFTLVATPVPFSEATAGQFDIMAEAQRLADLWPKTVCYVEGGIVQESYPEAIVVDMAPHQTQYDNPADVQNTIDDLQHEIDRIRDGKQLWDSDRYYDVGAIKFIIKELEAWRDECAMNWEKPS